ncbi:hypothetical protein OL548_07050 [Lysinibacillus sp. MHQ-1]|nr:hypothetical protein OL548_07050 [Lysinibacillus sp. MHQ-1]
MTTWLTQFADEQVSVRVYGDVMLQADELLLKRIMDNLITNAKKIYTCRHEGNGGGATYW